MFCTRYLIGLSLLLALSACDEKSSSGTDTKAPAAATSKASAEANKGEDGATEPAKEAKSDDASGMDCSSAKKTIESQHAALKAGAKLDDFKGCFTERQRGRLTQEMLDKAKDSKELSTMGMDDLFASEEPTEVDGKKAVKVKMKNGRTLTTLVQDGDRWLADTIWFK